MTDERQCNCQAIHAAVLELLMLLTVLILLTAIPMALGESNRRDIPLDSEEFLAVQHETYEANRLEALLEKHESVTFDLTDAPANDYAWREYWYITHDAIYYETPTESWYEFDRVNYNVYTGDNGRSYLIYLLDLTSNYDLWKKSGYQFPPEGDEAAWSDNGTDEHVACYIEDGLLYMRDRVNAEGSEAWFATNVPNETYDGETVYTEVVCDAETKEITEFNHYLEGKDGAMRRVKHHTAVYDAPEPRRVSNLRWASENYCKSTVDVTMVVDPGTDREFSKSLTLPVGSYVGFFCDNVDQAITCDDPDGTEVTDLILWDGMQNKTFYIFTEPTEEQAERYQALMQSIH